jgi:hypothetical protein
MISRSARGDTAPDPRIRNTSCGSALFTMRIRIVSRILSQCGSRSRVFMTKKFDVFKAFKNRTTGLIKNWKDVQGTGEASALKKEHPAFTEIWPLRMRSDLVVRASDCQCTSCNGPGFDPSIRRHSGIWGAADEAVLNIVRKKYKKSPQKILKNKKKHLKQ